MNVNFLKGSFWKNLLPKLRQLLFLYSFKISPTYWEFYFVVVVHCKESGRENVSKCIEHFRTNVLLKTISKIQATMWQSVSLLFYMAAQLNEWSFRFCMLFWWPEFDRIRLNKIYHVISISFTIYLCFCGNLGYYGYFCNDIGNWELFWYINYTVCGICLRKKWRLHSNRDKYGK